jgi:predicted deacetylase
MSARYLIRFDDLCPTMNWKLWREIEAILLERGIAPLLAVVPDNQDPSLVAGEAHPRFWDQVRKWQAQGWTIGLHGYQHRFVSRNAGIVGLHKRSEFAGLPEAEQEYKLSRAVEIFRREQIEPQAWVAPAHSFDETTVKTLKGLGIPVISDGFSLAPHRDSEGMLWVPQQLWKFRWRPFGVWTVCYHHNQWSAADLRKFAQDLAANRGRIANFPEVIAAYGHRAPGWVDSFYGHTHRTVIALRNNLAAGGSITDQDRFRGRFAARRGHRAPGSGIDPPSGSCAI